MTPHIHVKFYRRSRKTSCRCGRRTPDDSCVILTLRMVYTT